LADYLSVPLHKAERQLCRILFHRRMRAQHRVLEEDPAPALAGLTIRHPPQIRTQLSADPPKDLLAIGQRDAPDQMSPVSLLRHAPPPSLCECSLSLPERLDPGK